MAVSQGDVSQVLEQIERGPGLVISIIRQVPAHLVKRRPTPGVWSAHEHAVHLPAIQPMMMRRLDQMLSDPLPVITPYEPSRDDPDDALLSVDLDEAMERFVRDRGEMVQRLNLLTLDEWAKIAEHGEYSHYSVFIMFRHVALHDLYHAYRIEERLLRRDWA